MFSAGENPIVGRSLEKHLRMSVSAKRVDEGRRLRGNDVVNRTILCCCRRAGNWEDLTSLARSRAG